VRNFKMRKQQLGRMSKTGPFLDRQNRPFGNRAFLHTLLASSRNWQYSPDFSTAADARCKTLFM